MADPARELGRLGRRLGGNLAHALRSLAARRLIGCAPGGPWLYVRLAAPLVEQRLRGPALGAAERPPAFVDLLRALDAAAHDARLGGVVLRFAGAMHGFAKAAALRRAVVALRAAGKPVWTFSETYDGPQYYIASAADRVVLPPSGSLHLVGLRTQQMFAREALRRLDIEAEVVRIGSHKAAADPLTRRAMSPEQREQLDAWQGEVEDEWVAAIADGRSLDPARVRELIDEALLPVEVAAEAGLVDDASYPDEIEGGIRAAAGVEDEALPLPLIDVGRYFRLCAGDPGWRPLRADLPRIACVVAQGTIHRGHSQRGIGAASYAEIFSKLRRDPATSGVLLRIDSGGGDAVASDLLHRSLARLAQVKPVVVSMGEVAASGGYYLAAAGHEVLAERATLTGSIGVIGGKLNLRGFYRKLGLDFDAVERGEKAGLLSSTRAFTARERAVVQREMRSLYETFVARVAAGRSLETGRVEAIAQGRVWSGAAARERGLVDAVGGPLEALAALRTRAAIAEGTAFAVDVFPARPAWQQWPARLLGVSTAAGGTATLH